jgi:hypothetical protein
VSFAKQDGLSGRGDNIKNESKMYAQAEKPKENRSKEVAGSVARKKADPIIQRKAVFENGGLNTLTTIESQFKDFESKEGISDQNHLDVVTIKNGYEKMLLRAENFGVFDLDLYQNIALLYHTIKRQASGAVNIDAEKALVERDKPHKAAKAKDDKLFKDHSFRDFAVKGFYDMALLGGGSSMAYYVTSLGKAYDYSHTIIIGQEDPWANKRGKDWVVNHPMGMIQPWGEKAPESQFPDRVTEFQASDPRKEFASRTVFAEKNKAAIEAASEAKHVKAKVTVVGRFKDLKDDQLRKVLASEYMPVGRDALLNAIKFRLGNGFSLDSYVVGVGDDFYAANKVVMATGGGPHFVPKHADAGKIVDERVNPVEDKETTLKGMVMDMDQFMRLTQDQIQDKTVVVQGTNAGIDAADRTVDFGGTLAAWLGSAPPLLHKSLLEHAPSKAVASVRVRTERDKEKIKLNSDGRLEISFIPLKGEKATVISPVQADFFVYAIGQDVNKEDEESQTTGPSKILAQGIKDELNPYVKKIKDAEGRLAYAKKRKKEEADNGNMVKSLAWDKYIEMDEKLIAGWKKEVLDKSLIHGDGAGAFDKSFAMGLHHGKSDDEGLIIIGAAAWRLSRSLDISTSGLDKMADVVPSNVVSYEQLGALKSSIGALNTFIPKHIGQGFNWLTADQNMIRAFLEINHPGTSDELAAGFYKAVIQLRRLYPNGIPENVKEAMLTEEIREELTKEMGLETWIFLRSATDLDDKEVKAKLNSIFMWAVPEADLDDFMQYKSYGQLSPEEIAVWCWNRLKDIPNEALPKKKR